MTAQPADLVFAVDLAALIVLLAGTCWSIARPRRRLWPPPGRRSWQYAATWVCFAVAFVGNAALIVLDWNTGLLRGSLRFALGVPLVVVGALGVGWGVATLGAGNTSGLRQGFVRAGPYRFTRNPQYLGDTLLFLGLSFVADSRYLWVTHALLILVFVLAPLAEEVWLEEQYGEPYRAYRRETPRFL